MTLYATDCTSLERLSNFSRFQNIPGLFLTNCRKLVEIPGLEKLESIGIIHMEGCNNLANTFKESLLQGWSGSGYGGIFLPGDEIPNWFSHQGVGPSLSFQVLPILGCKMKGFTVCVVYASGINKNISDAFPRVTVIDKTKGLDWTFRPTAYDIPITPEDLMWVSHLPHFMFRNQLDGGDQVEVVVDLGDDGFNVKKCGVHLVYDQAESCTQSNGGELIMYNSASNKNATVVGDDGDVFEDLAGSKAKRGRDDDDDAGRSHEDQHPKRLRYQAGSAKNIDKE